MSKSDCVILRSSMVWIANNARVPEQWPTTPKYDVAEITTFVTSRHADANVDFAKKFKIGQKIGQKDKNGH